MGRGGGGVRCILGAPLSTADSLLHSGAESPDEQNGGSGLSYCSHSPA